MKTFHAQMLFDGTQWQSSKVFQVTDEGLFLDADLPSLEEIPASEITSLGVVIPGFINCHSHSFQRAMAGLGERISESAGNDSFWTWRDQMYRLAHRVTPETFKVIADWLYVEMLQAGYTSVGEFHYLHKQSNGQSYDDVCEMAQQLITSASETQVRLCLLPVFYQHAGIGQKLLEKQNPFGMATLQEFTDFHQLLSSRIPEGNMLGAAAHSIRAVDQEALEGFVQHFGKQEIPLHIHIAEQPAEVEESLKNYGERPVEFLLNRFSIDSNWTLVHATHITEQEQKAMAESGAVVGICTLTEANLGDGIFPTKSWLNKGGAIAIGSDSHIRIDPFEELRWIEYGQRYQQGTRACLTTVESPSPGLNLAAQCYQGGRQSLKLPVGHLKNGNHADFVVLRSDHPSAFRQDPKTLWDELLFAGSREMVDQVYVGGNCVVNKGQHLLRSEKLEALRQFYLT